MKKEIEVILPYLVRSSNEKPWYVEYKCFREKTEKLERFRIYKGFNERNSVAERELYAEQLIKAYATKLKSGWRPWAAERYIYHDEIEYWNVTEKFGSARNDNSHIRKYLSDYLVMRKKELSPKSYESYLSKTRLFCQWLEKKGHSNIKIMDISNEIVKAFFTYLIDDRKLDKLTVVKYRQNLGGMFKYFKKKKLIDIIPMEDLPAARKTKDMAARPLMDNDIKLYFNYVAKHDSQLFLASIFQFYLCCRPGKELREMKIGDLDLYRKQVNIRLETGKTGKRMISMPDALIEICQEFKLDKYDRDYYVFSRGGTPGIDLLSKNHFSNRFRDVRASLNLPKTYKFYSMKHTGAGKLLESGATFAELMSHCGHTSVESTIAYVRRHFGEKSQKVIDFRPDVLRGISQARG
jgi:integrase